MILQKIFHAKEQFFLNNKKLPLVIVLNYDTALMAFSNETGGAPVCYDLTGKDNLCGMQLIISNKLKNEEIILGGKELLQKYAGN
ncbi:MAG TPA: hypothetical protein VD908_06720 [Cytophagales bacterium]|nr:hypothetical protein [Cytophagales bacterium]